MHHTNGFHPLRARQYFNTPDEANAKSSEAPNAFDASHKTLQSRGSKIYFTRSEPVKDWLAVAHGQAGASAQREARFFFRHARRDLQCLIGDFEGKDLLFSLFKSQHGLHGTILSFASGASSQLRVAQKNAPSQRHRP